MRNWLRRRLLRRRGGSERAEGPITVPPATDHGGDTATIRDSGLFDDVWYRSRYPDLDLSGIDPLDHFMTSGWREGRAPGPGFDTVWYLSENHDVAAAGINPLVHYLAEGRLADRPPTPLNDLQKFESFDRAARGGLIDSVRLSSAIERITYPLAPGQPETDDGPLRLPPVSLSRRIGSPTLEGFETVGRETKRTLVRCLPPGFSFEGARCLDFGCGIGRVIRHFDDEARRGEFWGCDIDGTSIHWCFANLTPRFKFFQLSESPVLPFESNTFDFVYAVGVFTSVFRDWSVWLLEIRRILRPGGVFLVSYNGQTVHEEILGRSYEATVAETGMLVEFPYQSWNKSGPMVFLSTDWIRRVWGSMFHIDFIAHEGLMDFHSLCLMRKPETSSAVAPETRVVSLNTTQSFDRNAMGKIELWHDPGRPFLDSYGLQHRGDFDARGWIVLRDDEPVGVEARIDGRRVPATGIFTPADEHRDWGTAAHTFVVHCRVDGVDPGTYKLELSFEGRRGARHTLGIPLILEAP